MNKKIIIILWLIFMGVTVLTSCSLQPLKNIHKSEADQSQDTDSDLIIVGFSQLGSESDWRTANTKSIQNALIKENGFSLIYANGRQSQENQIKDLRSFIFQEVDYIVVAPVTETGWDTVLMEAKQANIPVIIVDRMISTVDDSLYVACVGTNKYEEGVQAGRWLEEYLSEKANQDNTTEEKQALPKETEPLEENGQSTDQINIVVLEGTVNSTAQIGRSKGFEDITKNHKNWNILAHDSGDFTKAKGREVMMRYINEFDSIDVLVSQNDDMTFGAIEAIQEAGLTCGVNGEITVISFDAVSEAFDMMETGLINVDIECNPLQGPLIAEIIERLEQGETPPKVSYVEGKTFDAENATIDRIGRNY